MACQQNYGHCVALNVYYVDQREHEAMENLSSAKYPLSRSLYPVMQVRATRDETLGSVLQRCGMMMHQPSNCPVAFSYSPSSITYNGFAIDIQAFANTPIGQVLNDPRTNLLILNGTLTIANCCCLNYCIISCCSSEPKFAGPRYVTFNGAANPGMNR